MLYNKTIIRLSVGESGGYLPPLRRIIVNYRNILSIFSFFIISVIIIIIIIIIIITSEKPPWGADNKICFVLYCITSHFTLHVESVAQW